MYLQFPKNHETPHEIKSSHNPEFNAMKHLGGKYGNGTKLTEESFHSN